MVSPAFLKKIYCSAATDNHIGYLEKDPVRCNDSLEAFEEVLKIAKDQEVQKQKRFKKFAAFYTVNVTLSHLQP